MCLREETLHYILEEFYSYVDSFVNPQDAFEGNEKDLIQLFIDKSHGILRMYGSAEELLENVNIYKDFPGNHKFFEINRPYQMRPRIFTNFKNEKYIAKSDVFVILQNMMLNFREVCPKQTHTMIALYLEMRQDNIGMCTEFVKFDEKRFEEMQKKMKEEIKKRQLSKIFIEVFGENIHSSQSRAKTEGVASFYLACSLPVKVLGTIIDENLEMFSPRHKNSNEPITLRVFEDGDQQFLMRSEVSNALIASSTLNKRLDSEDDKYEFHTISLEEIQKNFDTKNIEFIHYPILRAKHRANPISIPIPGKSDEFCILAIDTFFQYFKELILGVQYYQKVDGDNINAIFPALKTIFKSDCTTPYFLFIGDRGAVRRVVISFFENFGGASAKELRKVETDGFTVPFLKNELAYLGLTTTFPEILDYAEVVYAEVDKHKKESVLRTCDLFDAVEHCQLNCVLERLPELKKFVHSQKGCHRVYGFKCEDCNSENPENQEDQKLSILEKEIADLKMSYQKVLEENQQKTLENQELQQKNLRLSVKNESNEVQIKQLTEKLTHSKLAIDDGNYSIPCTSQLKIQCLICEKPIPPGHDQIIKCPMCKRRFHSKCAINWLKEHQQCPACNGELPKF
ncbi:hypothetical protein B9Z55_004366 [Caenorhabditis nigoni]|nr:hypothetical protein B9Z55_004366 [Caenorhabditis nigoni]